MTVIAQYFYLDELKNLGPCEVVRQGEQYVTFRRPDGSLLEMEIKRLSWATQEQLRQEELKEVTK